MDELFTHEREGEEGMWPASLHVQPPKTDFRSLRVTAVGFFSSPETKGDISFLPLSGEFLFLSDVGREGPAEGDPSSQTQSPVYAGRKSPYEDRGGLSKHRRWLPADRNGF